MWQLAENSEEFVHNSHDNFNLFRNEWENLCKYFLRTRLKHFNYLHKRFQVNHKLIKLFETLGPKQISIRKMLEITFRCYNWRVERSLKLERLRCYSISYWGKKKVFRLAHGKGNERFNIAQYLQMQIICQYVLSALFLLFEWLESGKSS